MINFVNRQLLAAGEEGPTDLRGGASRGAEPPELQRQPCLPPRGFNGKSAGCACGARDTASASPFLPSGVASKGLFQL